jgi:hypothetical protein
MTNIETIDGVEQPEMRSLSDAELDIVTAGCACAQTVYEVKCPIGHLTVVRPISGDGCPSTSVSYHL